MEETVKSASGMESSKIPPFHLIPRDALVALALRMGKGVRVKGDAAWNALCENPEAVLKDEGFLIERLSHVVDHCYKALARLKGNLPHDPAEDVDGGDAGAIMFGGALLACVMEYRREIVNSIIYQKPDASKPHPFVIGDERASYCLVCGMLREAAIHENREQREIFHYFKGPESSLYCDQCGRQRAHEIHQKDFGAYYPLDPHIKVPPIQTHPFKSTGASYPHCDTCGGLKSDRRHSGEEQCSMNDKEKMALEIDLRKLLIKHGIESIVTDCVDEREAVFLDAAGRKLCRIVNRFTVKTDGLPQIFT